LQWALLSSTFNEASAEAPLAEGAEPPVEPELLPEPTPVAREDSVEPPVAEAPLPPPPVIDLPPPAPMVVEAPKIEPPAPELPPLPPVAVPALVPVKLAVPEIRDVSPLVFRDAQTGDTPMIRNWQTLALYSLMTSAVVLQAPAPVLAQDKESDSKTVLERLDKLNQSIGKSFEGVAADMKKLKDDIKTMGDDAFDNRLKITNMEAALKELRADLDAIKKRGSNGIAGGSGLDKGSVDEIKAKLGAIEAAILKLVPSTSRTALSPPSQVGRVVLLNLHPEELLFLVNDKNVRVPPGKNVTLESISAGPVTYEIFSETWGPRGRRTTMLTANETLTLTAR
jgi:hypothetical protein